MAKLISILILLFFLNSAYAREWNVLTCNAKSRNEVLIVNVQAPSTRTPLDLIRLFQIVLLEIFVILIFWRKLRVM